MVKREDQRMADKKISRNDPCPCGSGKKYKHCCMRSGKQWPAAKPFLPRRVLPAAVAPSPEPLHRGPYGRVDDKLKSIARQTQGPAPWKTLVEGLTDRTKVEERIRAYQAVRDAKALPEDAGFVLIGLMIEWLSADPAYASMPRADDVGEEAWHKAFDALIAGLLRRFGENTMAELYERDRLEYDRHYERGRQFFFGPPDEEYARVLRERGVIG